MGRKPLLSFAEIEDLHNKGLTYTQIAKIKGVTKQAVSKVVRLHGGSQTPRQTVGQHFPWKEVPRHFRESSPYKRMRDHGEWMATGGKGMQGYKLDRLRWWHRYLRENNVVLEFDPEIPAIDGVSPGGGFAYRPRQEEDGDLLIRVNGYTQMSPESYTIWVLPDPGEGP
ncbi:XRE family transcriptional regulator [Nocardia arthritidis]|uniref:XRE family transcriptional regulator n=1 Tax=Nocardia arthritidis TaxID=228602 RepID=A0A6G9YTE9_9NOCA|nr:XRE family transcriptional regulator [Nocardia arthritidis]QIS16474.1 XRE family transcriptional regulator [Nocardia arthritidis]